MKVLVVTRSGKELIKGGLELNESATVADLQEAIHKRTRKYYPSRQRLTLPIQPGSKERPTVLHYQKSLNEYTKGSTSELTVVFKDLGPQVKDTLNWAVHRHLFYPDADALRERFEVNRKVEDVETIDRLIADGEASYNKWRHPDPYIVPWAPGGSKFNRNPVPPEGIEIVYDYGKEEAELV